MKKLLIENITKCEQCPHSVMIETNDGGDFYCEQEYEMGIINIYKIPDWCPLPYMEARP